MDGEHGNDLAGHTYHGYIIGNCQKRSNGINETVMIIGIHVEKLTYIRHRLAHGTNNRNEAFCNLRKRKEKDKKKKKKKIKVYFFFFFFFPLEVKFQQEKRGLYI